MYLSIFFLFHLNAFGCRDKIVSNEMIIKSIFLEFVIIGNNCLLRLSHHGGFNGR